MKCKKIMVYRIHSDGLMEGIPASTTAYPARMFQKMADLWRSGWDIAIDFKTSDENKFCTELNPTIEYLNLDEMKERRSREKLGGD